MRETNEKKTVVLMGPGKEILAKLISARKHVVGVDLYCMEEVIKTLER